MGFWEKIKAGLQKTRDAWTGSIQRLLNSFTKIDEDLFEQLEETMIMGDMGVETSVEICERLRALVKERGVKDPAKIMDLIEEIIGEMMGEDSELHLDTKPSVVVVIGVNGAGKTTTIGKLCHQYKEQGKKVLVAAADTFRAAAIDQLEVWTQRAGVDIVKHAEGSDPAAVVFDAITAAIARECDLVIIDTAGRLHNKKNLMDELAKINRIITQRAEGCSIETLLVLDATTGQNAVSQAKLFSEVANITGIVLTKLDGTAKGGIVVSIKNELGIPVKLIGVGEKIDDLQPFDNASFVRALFDREQEQTEETAEAAEETEEMPESEEAAKTAEELAEPEEMAEEPAEPEEMAEEPAEPEEMTEEPEEMTEEPEKTEETTEEPEESGETAEEAEEPEKMTEEPEESEETTEEPEESEETAEEAEEAAEENAEPEPEEKPKKWGWWPFGRKNKKKKGEE